MPTTAKSARSRKSVPYTVSVQPGEVVPRGRAITVETRVKVSAESARGITVAGQRVDVETETDGRSFHVDTADLPCGDHLLRIEEIVSQRGKERLADSSVPFIVVDTKAPLPADLVVHHAVRFRIGDLDIERLPMVGIGDGPFIDVFKAEDRRSHRAEQLAYDHKGRPVDLDAQLARLAKRRRERYGVIHPTLHDAMERGTPDTSMTVAVWLHVPDEPLPEKSSQRALRQPPSAELERRERWKSVGSRFAGDARRVHLEVERIDEAAPVIFGRIPAGRIAELANSNDVAAVFLYEPEGFEDLSDSIDIANADDAHSGGTTGTGVNVAVYENGPDDLSMLSITDRFSLFPTTSDHSRHTHGIIKNVQRSAPHGHAPDCNLHSANSKDLAAIRWAAQDAGCTVISQSFHRDSEQTSSGLSFDDVYKDYLALHWPYPTICEAAGNGSDTEFVNHKGFNRLTVGNHNDSASAMASDTVFRNPGSNHGDRELPEIAANGVNVTTVGLTFGGTSMAAPAVAGGAALIQQRSGTLKSWPEGCRAILMAAAWRNPAGGTWRSDLINGIDGVDGAGALDSNAAVQIARNRRRPNSAASRRGWDVGTFRSSDVGRDGFATYVYRVTVPRTLIGAHVKVALAWDSKVTTRDFLGIPIPFSSHLTVDLDLHVRDSSGTTVASSASWDNSYEIAEFSGARGQTYEIRIRRWSGSDDVWYGIAWTVTGFELLVDKLVASGLTALGRR